MQEFCLITGLPCHQVADDLSINNDRLRYQYFNGAKKISMIILFEAFHMCEDYEDKFKLGLVMLVECILKPTGRVIDYRTLSMVEQLDHFLAYPWGRKAYFVLLKSLQESQFERAKRMQQNEPKDCKYALRGYPLAFQYWIYEAFPQIGEKFGHCRYRTLQCPRMHKWKPKEILIEKVVKRFFATEQIQVVVPILQPTEEELETIWYTNLSLPVDNEHCILDGIANGQFENVVPDSCANTSGSRVGGGVEAGVGPSAASVGSSHVTRDEMEEMFNMYKQHIVSDVSNLYGNLKTEILEESKRRQAEYHQESLDNQRAQYQAIIENQRQFFQEQQQWQEEYFQRMQSSMQSYVDMSLTSVKSYVDEQNKSVLNKLSDWESNMEAIIASTQEVQPKYPSTSQ